MSSDLLLEIGILETARWVQAERVASLLTLAEVVLELE